MEQHSLSSSFSSSSLTADEEKKPESKQVQLIPPTKILYQDFWCSGRLLPNVISFQKHFQALDQDIILASQPKSGTTWLKALIFSVVNRTRFTVSNTPLLTSNPHELIPFFEAQLYAEDEIPDFSTMPSPRLFSTHIPYASLPESIKHSECRIVYICRNPLDVIVSFWKFLIQFAPSTKVEDLAETWCNGEDGFGPFWNHVLGYWNESLKKPNRVFFLKYEDLKDDIVGNLKKLAVFIGFPFSMEEERQGVIEDISKLCSLNNLKNLEVNKNGKINFPKIRAGIEKKSYFRKGEVGDWVNHLNPSVVECLDRIIQEKLSGSGLTFKV
ncbi:Sulfotransferase [Quillaja saponaria]|uniref:Sulfotransferase n=1 Tax=Quillaja saponaria TaxID=32244 RepID=A0AAD7L3R8_QUISA|nr:Sulfotransferase [Quillaja saponaria]